MTCLVKRRYLRRICIWRCQLFWGWLVAWFTTWLTPFFVAKTGDANLVAGVALGAPLFTFMLAVGDIFGLGGSALISRLLGTGDHTQVRLLSSFCLYAQ